MTEKVPNVLPIQEQKVLQDDIAEVAGVAHEADLVAGRQTNKHNSWVDGSRHEASSRLLGQLTSDHRVTHRGTLHGGVHDSRTDTRIRTGERTIHAYSDRRHESTTSEMEVTRNGETKILRSTNPAVFNMLTRIALKDIRAKAEADLEKSQQKAA